MAGQRGTEESFAEADQSNWSLGNRIHKRITSEVRHIRRNGGDGVPSDVGRTVRIRIRSTYTPKSTVVRTLLYKFDDGAKFRDWHGPTLTPFAAAIVAPPEQCVFAANTRQKQASIKDK